MPASKFTVEQPTKWLAQALVLLSLVKCFSLADTPIPGAESGITECPSSLPTECPALDDSVFLNKVDKKLFQDVCVEKGTERPVNRCHGVHEGVFTCQCCGQPLFDAADKCESKTGWPSFTKSIGACVKDDGEVVCGKCGAHLGDYFRSPGWESDAECYLNGVPSRYCIDGICMKPPQGTAFGSSCTSEPCHYSDRVYFGASSSPSLLNITVDLETDTSAGADENAFHRTKYLVTSRVGYAGGVAFGDKPVCASSFSTAGYAEVVEVALSPESHKAVAEFQLLLHSYLNRQTGTMTAKPADLMIGVPGGIGNVAYMHMIHAEAIKLGLEVISGTDSSLSRTDAKQLAVYDSIAHPFFLAELSKQFVPTAEASLTPPVVAALAKMKQTSLQRYAIKPVCDEVDGAKISNKMGSTSLQCSLRESDIACKGAHAVYFGDGCFWHTQYDFYVVERGGYFNRSLNDVTVRTGYGGGIPPNDDMVCYHDGPEGTPYHELGFAEAAQVMLDEDEELAELQFFALADKFFRDGFEKRGDIWIRNDPQDAGAEYRNIIGIPGGMDGKYFPILQRANLHNMGLRRGGAHDTIDEGIVYVYDSVYYPFYRAERYHQFHENKVLKRELPSEYLINANSLAIRRGYINKTCRETDGKVYYGSNLEYPPCQWTPPLATTTIVPAKTTMVTTTARPDGYDAPAGKGLPDTSMIVTAAIVGVNMLGAIVGFYVFKTRQPNNKRYRQVATDYDEDGIELEDRTVGVDL